MSSNVLCCPKSQRCQIFNDLKTEKWSQSPHLRSWNQPMLSILAWSHQKVSITPDWLMNWRTVSSPSVCLSEHSVLVRNSRVLLHLCESVKRVFLCECASVGGEVKKHGRGVLQKKKKRSVTAWGDATLQSKGVCVCLWEWVCACVCVCVCVWVCVWECEG